MLLPAIGYLRPASLDEAVATLASDPSACVLAGGQTLLNVLKLRLAAPSVLVDVGRLDPLRGIRVTASGGVRIGAAATYDQIAASGDVEDASPVVARVASTIVDRQVRARGTIGGNACLNDPTSNYPPLLLALEATFHVFGPQGWRDVAAGEFFLAPYMTAVGSGELLGAITVPRQASREGVGYASQLIGRDSWALARAVAWLRGGDRIDAARVVVGCTAPRPARQPATESALVGREPVVGALAGGAAALAGENLEMVGDVHASADYRLRMARVMVRRAIDEAIADRRADVRA